MAELKPCVCGSENWCVWYCCTPDKRDIVGYYVDCDDCGEATSVYKTEEEAVEAWNRMEVDGNDA